MHRFRREAVKSASPLKCGCAGLDYGIQGPWSFTAEYNYVNLGKGTNSTFTCTANNASICATYANLSLDNIHNSFTMNMFRVGFHYGFK